MQIDNDLFSGAHRDQDYSWGAARDTTPRRVRASCCGRCIQCETSWMTWLVPDETESGGWAPEQQATQIGILAMTPQIAALTRAALQRSAVRESASS